MMLSSGMSALDLLNLRLIFILVFTLILKLPVE